MTLPEIMPPINRRRFLAGALAAGAGTLLPRFAEATEPPGDPNHFVLLADTHVGSRRDQAHRGVQPAVNLERAVTEIAGLGPKPAGAIVTGDCAFMKGEAGDYTMLGELLGPLRQAGLPVHLALGNHDGRERLLAAFPEARSQAVAAELPQKCVSLLETPHADWFLLDSLDKTNVTLGLLGQRQLAWLAKALDAHPAKPALVLAHHNPDRLLNIHGLTDTKALFEVLMPRRRVKAFFYGHTHCWHLGQQAGVYLVNLPAVAWLFDQTQPRGFVTSQLRPTAQCSCCTRSITSIPKTERRSS